MNIALVIAGGVGARMGQDIPKQFLSVDDRPIIIYALKAFQDHSKIDSIAVVCISGWEEILLSYARQFGITKLDCIVTGGKTGQDSIREGVFALEKKYSRDDIVLVHDAIRPMVSPEIITDCVEKTHTHGSAISSIPCAEAILTTENAILSSGKYPRENLMRTQTPQGFFIGDLCDMHRRALEEGITNSVASCTLAIELGKQVYFSMGSERNIKLTNMEDIELFRALLSEKPLGWQK